MFTKNLILILLFAFVLSPLIYSHEKNKHIDCCDSTKTWDWEVLKWEFENFQKKGKPAVSFEYGLSKINLKGINSSFAKPNLLELKIGHVRETPIDESDEILKYRFTNVFLSYISTELSNKTNSDGITSNLWRFGTSWSKGYGYKLGNSSIVLFNSGSFVWSRLDLKDLPPNPEDKDKLDRFNKSFRFGTSTEDGIKIKPIPLISVEAGYERAVIFERHLFWKWVGSEVIYFAAQGALDAFINEIKDSSPFAVPVVSFILKGALSYGMYQLRQGKMNWPFNTAPPLAYDQFKFGITFVF